MGKSFEGVEKRESCEGCAGGGILSTCGDAVEAGYCGSAQGDLDGLGNTLGEKK